MARLDDLCEIQIGRTPSRREKRYWGRGHPWLSIADLSRGTDVHVTAEEITDAAVAECRCRLIPTGTLVMSFKLSVGKLGFLRRPMYTNEAIAALPIRDPQRVDDRFLFRALQASPVVAGADRGAMGLVLNSEKLARIQVPLPPIEDQRRVADILDRADAIRCKRRDAIPITEDLLRSTFLEMFGDPVTNPKGWNVSRLGDVVELYAGNSLPNGVAFHGQAAGVLHVKVGDMNLPGNESELRASREWSPSATGATVAPAGVVVFPKRGGAIATNKKRVAHRRIALDPNLMAAAPRAPLTLDYLSTWFDLLDLATLISGSAVPQLNKRDLGPLSIQMPSRAALESFSAFSTQARVLRAKTIAAHAESERLFDVCVAHAFSDASSTPQEATTLRVPTQSIQAS
jgi:type I restriction enzyme S subunit